MKNRILPLLMVALLTITLTNCKKKAGPLSCANNTIKYTQSLTAFITDQSKGNCEAVKNSILKLYDSCSAISGLDRAEYEEFENDFDCSNI